MGDRKWGAAGAACSQGLGCLPSDTRSFANQVCELTTCKAPTGLAEAVWAGRGGSLAGLPPRGERRPPPSVAQTPGAWHLFLGQVPVWGGGGRFRSLASPGNLCAKCRGSGARRSGHLAVCTAPRCGCGVACVGVSGACVGDSAAPRPATQTTPSLSEAIDGVSLGSSAKRPRPSPRVQDRVRRAHSPPLRRNFLLLTSITPCFRRRVRLPGPLQWSVPGYSPSLALACSDKTLYVFCMA